MIGNERLRRMAEIEQKLKELDRQEKALSETAATAKNRGRCAAKRYTDPENIHLNENLLKQRAVEQFPEYAQLYENEYKKSFWIELKRKFPKAFDNNTEASMPGIHKDSTSISVEYTDFYIIKLAKVRANDTARHISKNGPRWDLIERNANQFGEQKELYLTTYRNEYERQKQRYKRTYDDFSELTNTDPSTIPTSTPNPSLLNMLADAAIEAEHTQSEQASTPANPHKRRKMHL